MKWCCPLLGSYELHFIVCRILLLPYLVENETFFFATIFSWEWYMSACVSLFLLFTNHKTGVDQYILPLQKQLWMTQPTHLKVDEWQIWFACQLFLPSQGEPCQRRQDKSTHPGYKGKSSLAQIIRQVRKGSKHISPMVYRGKVNTSSEFL